jgi:hypothetical protein
MGALMILGALAIVALVLGLALGMLIAWLLDLAGYMGKEGKRG